MLLSDHESVAELDPIVKVDETSIKLFRMSNRIFFILTVASTWMIVRRTRD